MLLGEAQYHCSAKARLKLREKILSKIFQIDMANIEHIGAVSAVNTAGQGVENMQVYYSQYLPTLVFCIISPFYVFWQLSQVSLEIAVVLAIIALIVLPANNVFKSITEKLKDNYWKSLHDMTSHYLENLKGLTTLKLFNRDEERTQSLKVKTNNFNAIMVDVMRSNFYSVALTYLLTYGGIFIALIITCVKLSSGELTISAGLMILMLSFSFFTSFKDLLGATHNALSGISAAHNISRLFEIDTKRKHIPMPKEKAKSSDEGIVLLNVTYSYPNRDDVLKEISVFIPKGKVVALVGSSGCGKSTIASLLLRFTDPKNGKITFNGIDYLCYSPRELRNHITIVPQTVSIFSGTIEENLRVAKPNATEEEMLTALHNVRLKDWLTSQPHGLKTDVGDSGAKLSGGQRQKIGIARALLCNAEYIVLDEATSGVDMESEMEIWNCISELSQQKTLIIISHRLSTIKNADIIYVLDQGKVENSGNHAKLIVQSKLYSTLVKQQDVLEKQGKESMING